MKHPALPGSFTHRRGAFFLSLGRPLDLIENQIGSCDGDLQINYAKCAELVGYAQSHASSRTNSPAGVCIVRYRRFSGRRFNVGNVDCVAGSIEIAGDGDHLTSELFGLLLIIECINFLGRGIVEHVLAASFHARKRAILSRFQACCFIMASCDPILAHALSMISPTKVPFFCGVAKLKPPNNNAAIRPKTDAFTFCTSIYDS
jgi:hypothetical protein